MRLKKKRSSFTSFQPSLFFLFSSPPSQVSSHRKSKIDVEPLVKPWRNRQSKSKHEALRSVFLVDLVNKSFHLFFSFILNWNLLLSLFGLSTYPKSNRMFNFNFNLNFCYNSSSRQTIACSLLISISLSTSISFSKEFRNKNNVDFWWIC